VEPVPVVPRMTLSRSIPRPAPSAHFEDHMPHCSEEITAFHEAGHAVVALALGRGVQRVSILPDETRLGVCEIRKGAVKPSNDDLETAILIFLGGLAAEARLTGVYGWAGASEDLREVHAMCLARAGNDKRAEKLVRRMISKAEHLLEQPGMWAATQRLAAELMSRTTISGRAARHLFEEAHLRIER
jgi:ATP-dependent Zn protease